MRIPLFCPPFYTNDAAFDESAHHIAAQLRLLMDQRAEQGYFPAPAKWLFIADKPEEEDMTRQEFEWAGLNISYVDGSRYLGAFLRPREELDEWVRTKVGAWAHGVRTLDKIAKQYPQLAYYGLGMSLQLEWQYLQRTEPGVDTMMGHIEYTLREALFHALFGGEEVRADLR